MFSNMFWENFWVNFLSSVAAGITLGLLGISGYKIYKYLEKNNVKQIGIEQKTDFGKNTVQIKKQININFTEKPDKEIIKKLTK